MGFATLGLVSCKKEGCTDNTATNYNSKAKKDDGSCTYAPKASKEETMASDLNGTWNVTSHTYAGMEYMGFTLDSETFKFTKTSETGGSTVITMVDDSNDTTVLNTTYNVTNEGAKVTIDGEVYNLSKTNNQVTISYTDSWNGQTVIRMSK